MEPRHPYPYYDTFKEPQGWGCLTHSMGLCTGTVASDGPAGGWVVREGGETVRATRVSMGVGCRVIDRIRTLIAGMRATKTAGGCDT